ncbi:MAG: NAD(P)/FAD-dependent oxidoreductase [Candidatus Nanoarchaeia archaeon]|nr:NAD(P)/FAD-dependent oxidoreductase [Candidatus Nanoarchaeia archaeon]
MESDITIIGAGVVGLAMASQFANENTFIIEKNTCFGMETSSRNSEVIHSGVYYQKDSLKSVLCIQGNSLLYEFCERYNIAHRRIGKIIVANNELDEKGLESLMKNATLCGVNDIRELSKKEICAMEPNISASSALLSPNTGILDSHGLMSCYAALAKEKGANIIYNAMVEGIELISGGYKITINSPSGRESFTSQKVINAAGLHSDEIASLAGVDLDKEKYNLHYCKGDYFSISGRHKNSVNRLVYPVANKDSAGLGVHLTLDLAGQMRIGPDTAYLNDRRLDYTVNMAKKEMFFISAKSFLPFLEPEDLEPAFSGIRPKLQGPNDGFCDFIIHEESEKGLPGLINLIGIESPGLTASLAIAKYVKKLMDN